MKFIFRQLTGHFDDMVLAFGVWMCTLPLVSLLILPSLGWKTSLLAAVALLVLLLLVCQGICSWKIFHSRGKG